MSASASSELKVIATVSTIVQLRSFHPFEVEGITAKKKKKRRTLKLYLHLQDILVSRLQTIHGKKTSIYHDREIQCNTKI